MQSQFKTIQPQLKTTGSDFSCIHTKSQLVPLQFSIGKSDNLGIF